ncbi:MAG: L-2-hydroxyglutarate oxidase [Gemmatimonadota bacterium]
MQYRVIIIGGGLVGLATAYRYLQRHPGSDVLVVEKEDAVGLHQSGRNSGVLHAGLHYRPGSLKARLAVSGIRQMTAFCEEHGIAHEICGKLVVATTAAEIPRLQELERRGGENGLRGLRSLGPEEAAEIEPNVDCLAALHVPEEGIVDFRAVCRALASEIQRLGGEVRTGTRVVDIRRSGSAWTVACDTDDLEARTIVNCAGLHADRIARLAGERPRMRIIPFRGEYYQLRPERRHLVRHLVYPVPDPAFPFLGVHLTRGVSGAVEAGPNAVLAMAREGYDWRTVVPRDLLESITSIGLIRFLLRYPRASIEEVRRSFSKSRFLAALQRLVPAIELDDLVRDHEHLSGVRAQAVLPTGELVQDFHLLRTPGAVHVLNAPSPAATAALSIGEEIGRELELTVNS